MRVLTLLALVSGCGAKPTPPTPSPAAEVCCESFGYGAQMVKCCESYAWTPAEACVDPGMPGGGKAIVDDALCPAR